MKRDCTSRPTCPCTFCLKLRTRQSPREQERTAAREYIDAHEKDWLENRLHKDVCNGDITLEDAQKEIKTDWYATYLKRKHSK